jgi:hypothetical protein
MITYVYVPSIHLDLLFAQMNRNSGDIDRFYGYGDRLKYQFFDVQHKTVSFVLSSILSALNHFKLNTSAVILIIIMADVVPVPEWETIVTCVAVIAVPVALLHKVQARLNVVLSITVEQRFRDPTALSRLARAPEGVQNIIAVVALKVT